MSDSSSTTLETLASVKKTGESLLSETIKIQRRVIFLLVLALAVVTGVQVNSNVTTNAIRSTQITNTTVLDQTISCQAQAINGLLKDIQLLINNDKNRKDYAVPQSCS